MRAHGQMDEGPRAGDDAERLRDGPEPQGHLVPDVASGATLLLLRGILHIVGDAYFQQRHDGKNEPRAVPRVAEYKGSWRPLTFALDCVREALQLGQYIKDVVCVPSGIDDERLSV